MGCRSRPRLTVDGHASWIEVMRVCDNVPRACPDDCYSILAPCALPPTAHGDTPLLWAGQRDPVLIRDAPCTPLRDTDPDPWAQDTDL